MDIQRVLLRHTTDGWTVKRPGWPEELTASREWAECLAESIAHESLQTWGRPVLIVLEDERGEHVLRRFQ